MISLKKHIESWTGRSSLQLASYRSLLQGVAKYSARAVPDLGPETSRSLAALNEGLARCSGIQELEETDQKAQTELAVWAERAFERHSENARDLKEIIGVLAKSIETVGERDTRYAKEMGELSDKLRAISQTDGDLASLRRSLADSANALSACVTRMTEESSASLRMMAEQVADYRSRADTSEKLSYVDPLTGLANRRRFEEQLEIKVKGGRVFSLIMIDMNNFKHVNDRHGHLAGDELLKQFAEELSGQFRLADLVTRWGGDEFAVIVNSNQNDAMARLNGLRRAALGQYKVTVGHKTISVTVDAAIGVVEWNRTETGKELLARADQSMYARKQSERSGRATAADTHSVSVHG